MSTMNQLGKYQPYQQYEFIDVPWYKQKPTHWLSVKFKHSFNEKRKVNNPNLPAGAISFGEVIYKDEEKLSQDTKDSYQEVLAGEFLINPLNLNFDLKSLRTALSTIDVVVSTGYIVLTMENKLNPRFSRWLLQQFDVSHMKTLGSGVRQTINYNDIGNSLFCLPTPEEQRTIAAFLDYETARIDQLIAKQRQLIELLKEKRQAVISHAVTKGLNPNAPMKDSGVEWLGQVPEHWGMTKVKHLCYVNDGNHGEEYPKENDYTTQELGVPFIRGGNMQRLSIVAEGMLYITKEKNDSMRKGRLEPEDILFMNRGEIGKLAKIPTSYAGANLNSQIAYLRCHKQKVVPDFMLFFLSSTNVQNMISSMKMGSVLTQFPIADIIIFLCRCLVKTNNNRSCMSYHRILNSSLVWRKRLRQLFTLCKNAALP